MKIFIELWMAKDAWKELSLKDRQDYVAQMNPIMQDLMSKGLVIEAWGINEDETNYKSGYKFFAVSKFPTKELLQKFEAIIEAAGWYNFFEQVNVSGSLMSPEQVIGKMLEI